MTKFRQFSIQFALLSGILLLTALLIEVICITFNIFPPRYNYGDPELGWAPVVPGEPTQASCIDYASGERYFFDLNESGIKTKKTDTEILSAQNILKIASVGDSQTDLCAPNHAAHPGVLEQALNVSGKLTVVLPYAQGRYSPLQAYLLYQTRLTKYQPDILVLNLYTGNDFLDMLRDDDRPSLQKTSSGFAILPPTNWYLYDNPNFLKDSRLIFLFRQILAATGIKGFVQRVQVLFNLAKNEDQGIIHVAEYMNALRKTRSPETGYPAAFAAQMLNQQLFFHFFPESQQRSVERIEYLMCLAQAENPDTQLVLSALPSYQLVAQQPVDQAFEKIFSRLPIDYAFGITQETELYWKLQAIANECGWHFIDNLSEMQGYQGSERLYNGFDYHLTIPASQIIGEHQAASIAELLK